MFILNTRHRNISDDDLLADLVRVAAKLETDSVTIDRYNEFGSFHASTLTRRFGSWFKVLSAAGLKRTRNLHISDDELFDNLANCWLTLGRQPRYNDLSKETSAYSAGTYENRFGSWRNALELFVQRANGAQSYISTQPTIRQNESKNERFRNRNINWRLRALTLIRDEARCRLCGVTSGQARLHVDHVLPWSKGGDTTLENLQILCERCNVGKSDITVGDLQPVARKTLKKS